MSVKFVRSVVLASLFSLPLVLLSIQSAFASDRQGPVTFILINRTNRILEEFYASPPSQDTWEDNIFGNGFQLAPGAETEIVINDGRTICNYDLMGVLGENTAKDGPRVGRGSLIQSAVNVCNIETYEYYE